jgi:DNA-binding CsgD family transcriptional regulator
MAERPIHHATSYRMDLSPRQREVLDLIARGRTNAEIAEALGISLDGAKWHVREILGKLGVESREEAAEHWRKERQPLARLGRVFAGLSFTTLAKIGAGGAAGVLAVSGAALAVYVVAARADPSTDRAGCDAGRVQVALGEVAIPVGSGAMFAVSVSAREACSFAADLTVTIEDAFGVRASVVGNPATAAMKVDQPGKNAALVHARWSNWCGPPAPVFLRATAAGDTARIPVSALPQCTDPAGPSTLRFDGPATQGNAAEVDATPPGAGNQPRGGTPQATKSPAGNALVRTPAPFASACPVEQLYCDEARRVAGLVATGDFAALFAAARSQIYTCTAQPLPADASYAVCKDAKPGDQYNVLAIAQHGVGRPYVTEAEFKRVVPTLLGSSAKLVSIGCPDGKTCDRGFVVVFETGPGEFAYLAFERQGGVSRLNGAGFGGPDHATVVNGGNGQAVFGSAIYYRLP